MKPRFIWANLLSGDLKKTILFYSAWDSNEMINLKRAESTSFTFAENQFIINFFTGERLTQQKFGGLSVPENSNEIIFSISADSREEVDQWWRRSRGRGNYIFRPAEL
jgi:predicted lactoylglutathione lyase